MVTHSDQAGDPVGSDQAVEGVSVDGEGMDGVYLFAVAGEHQVSLVRDLEAGHCEDGLGSLGLLGSDSPHVQALLDGVDVDCAVLGPGGRHVQLCGDGDAGHCLVVAGQHLQK